MATKKTSKKAVKEEQKRKLEIKIKKPSFDAKKSMTESVSGLKSVYFLTKKELNNYFSSAQVYIVLTLFVIAVCAILFGVFRYLEYGTSDLTQMFTSIAFAFVFIIPALTMGSISKEKENTTLEYILTKPVTEMQFLFSKLLSVSVILIIMLVLTSPIAAYIGTTTTLDNGQLAMQYVGTFVLGLCFASIGVATSSLFKNEISSFLTSLVISGLFILTGSEIIRILPFQFDAILSKVGLYSHFISISRGVLDVRDVFYFAAFIFVFVVIGHYSLAKIKFPSNSKPLKIAQISLVLGIVITLAIGYLGQFIPGRIDFTANQKYTLSDTTKKIIGNVSEDMDITLYTSTNLPSEFQEELRSVEDVLRDYNIESEGKINVEKKFTDKDTEAAAEASGIGLQELVFAVNSEDSSQRAVGYFGLGLKYAEQTEVLSLAGGNGSITNEIEFQLTKKIQKLTKTDKKVIGFVPNNMARGRLSDYRQLDFELSELYTVEEVTLEEESPEIPEEIDVLVLPGPNAEFPENVLENIKEFFEDGKSIFFLAETIDVPLDSLVPVVNDYALGDFFADYGINIDQNFVYDLSSNNPINGGSELIVIPVNYPLWINAIAADTESPIINQVEKVSMLWASSITIENQSEKTRTITKLLETTEDANVQTAETLNLDPSQRWAFQGSDSIKTIALSLENEQGGRAVIVSDSLFLSDQYIAQQDNFTFALSSLEWLSGEDAVSEIKAKTRVAPRLNLTEDQQNLLIALGGGIPVVTVILLGASKYYQRRKELKKVYK